MRGEYPHARSSVEHHTELPPRARRIHFRMLNGRIGVGTTSACAENTLMAKMTDRLEANYLRVRGEYGAMHTTGATPLELPPRARRIPSAMRRISWLRGTTSACAENTCASTKNFRSWWNYLRVRGEYMPFTRMQIGIAELPPRARRILFRVFPCFCRQGTTSACAENTPTCRHWAYRKRNYLRVRGEYPQFASNSNRYRELPPRARRIP